MGSTPQMRFPGANMEVEIVLCVVSFRRRRLRPYFRAGYLGFLTGESHHPIRLPGFTPVIRECLLKAARICSDVRKAISREDRSASQILLIKELASAIIEFTNHRFVDHAVAAVRPIQTPLVSFGIV